jgi:ribonuclease HII
MSSKKNNTHSEIPPIFSHDEKLRSQYDSIAGIDEAGRGPLAGPVVAAAAILPHGCTITGLRDSKKISQKAIKSIFWNVVHKAHAIGVGIVDAGTIDEINILESTKLAMRKAVEDLGVKPGVLLIDAVKLDQMDIPQMSYFKGESVSASIAAASVVAKVVRDDIMLAYHKEYPAYNFKSHKGYSTREHMKKIELYGPCPIHRQSFRKVKDVPLPFENE